MAKGKEIYFRVEEEFSNVIDFLILKELADALKELLILKLKKLCLDSKNTLFLCSPGILEY